MLLVLLSKGRSMVTDELPMGIENGAPRPGPLGGSGGRKPRNWRTRADPFKRHRASIGAFLARDPRVQAKRSSSGCRASTSASIRTGSCARCSGASGGGAWRTGPERELFFDQEWRPGQQCQSGFTQTSSLGVTFLGEASGLTGAWVHGTSQRHHLLGWREFDVLRELNEQTQPAQAVINAVLG